MFSAKTFTAAANCMVRTIGHSGKGKTMETAEGSVVARSCGGGRDE